MQEHLFISYATEDAALAEWLTLKLTSFGYKAWCDRFELLGGERFPRDIDKAIKEKTFRLLSILSKASLEKQNPTKERTLALNIGRERKTDFLIPLKAEPLSATDLNWMVSDITYISFHESWASGLTQLLKKLDKIGAPRNLANGNQIAASALLDDDLIEQKSERLYSNLIEVKRIPELIQRFELRRAPSPLEADQMLSTWPVYRIDETTYLAFQGPPASLTDRLNIRRVGGAVWREVPTIDGFKSGDVVSSLLRRSIESRCLHRGLVVDREQRVLYFPNGMVKNNKLSFTGYDGRKTHLLAVGQRTKSGSKYRYHLAPQFLIRRNLAYEYSILLRVRLRITDLEGKALSRFSALARRKHVCARWWNSEWLKRQLAILEYLAEGGDIVSIGQANEEVRIASNYATYFADFGINEASLGATRTEEELAYLEAAVEEVDVEESTNE